MLHQPRSTSLRFHQPQCVHLVVLQHQQAHAQVVDLHLIHTVFVQLHRVDYPVGQQVSSRKARHRHHLVVQLFQLADTGVTVGHELPGGIRHRRIAQLHATHLHPLGTHQVGHHTLYPATLQGSVTVHLGHIELQAHTTTQRVVKLVVFGHIQRQTVQRGHHGHLQRSRIPLLSLLTTQAFLVFRLLVRLATCYH